MKFMKLQTKYLFIFFLSGFLFGALFPVIDSIIQCSEEQLSVNLQNIILVQKSTPLLWVINTAPLFLGLFAAFSGRQLDRLSLKNKELEQRFAERIETEKQLIQKNQELEESKRLSLIGEFAAGIAHEINNPLAVIHAKGQLLEMQLDQLNQEKTESSEKIMDSLEAIKRMTLHTSDLIKNLKTFSSKANFEKLDLVTLTDVIDMVLKISEQKCSNVGIQIDTNIDPNVKLTCSPSGLAQVILNLVSNSIDAIESQKDKWITIESNISSQTLKIIITDSGRGIPDEIVKKITQPFFSTKDPGKGTGLGLAISLKTIEKMKGQLYYNPKSENTQFIIEFKSFEV